MPAGGSATLSILGAGARETIKPGHRGDGRPEGLLAARIRRGPQGAAQGRGLDDEEPPPRPRRRPQGGRRLPLAAPRSPRPSRRSSGSTVAADRPALAWPPAERAETYRVKLLSGAGRELWRVEAKEPRVAFPAGKEPLQPGYVYRWEVTDQDFRTVAAGEFTVATAVGAGAARRAEGAGRVGRPGRPLSAALAYRRLAAYAEAIAAFERLAREVPDEPYYRKALADLEKDLRPGHRG